MKTLVKVAQNLKNIQLELNKYSSLESAELIELKAKLVRIGEKFNALKAKLKETNSDNECLIAFNALRDACLKAENAAVFGGFDQVTATNYERVDGLEINVKIYGNIFNAFDPEKGRWSLGVRPIAYIVGRIQRKVVYLWHN